MRLKLIILFNLILIIKCKKIQLSVAIILIYSISNFCNIKTNNLLKKTWNK
jgi:hypothetical protein